MFHGRKGDIVPRLFISHSSKNNVEALAFQRWLIANGWSEEDVFIDLHGIGAGERWRDTLRKANASCEAVILLASPDSLDSKECQREMNLAEDLGKEIMVAILRDLKKDEPRLARYADRQFVDLSTEPTERMEAFEWDGKVQRIEFHLPALQSIKARLAHLGIAPGSFSWTPRPGAGPYPGLAAFTEDDAGIFFGREASIMEGITELRTLRKRRSPRLLVIQAASGAGKSSFLRAGLWPRLMRDPDFAPLCILRPALGILTGPDGLGRKLSPWFQRHGKTRLAGDIHTTLAGERDGAFAALIEDATQIATAVRRAGAPDARPPAPLLAIDQGEELFAPENETESRRFLDHLAVLLREPPEGVDPYALITIRADSVEALLQRWPELGLDSPKSLYLPPLSPAAYRDVILKPAAVYSDRVHRLAIEPALADALVRDAVGADALPLLAFTLEKLFFEFGAAGELTLERYNAMGGIGGSIDRALAAAQRNAGTAGSADHLRRLIVPGLATWDPAAGAAKRLVATEAEVAGGDRKPLAPLANALVEARLLTRSRDTLEVAHEALLRRPPISGWLEDQKDALKLRDDVLKEAGEWLSDGKAAKDLVRRGERLKLALGLLRDPDFAAALAPAKDYLLACEKSEKSAKGRARRIQAVSYALLLSVILSLVGFIEKDPLIEQWHWFTKVRPYISANIAPYLLTAEKEKALKPGETFRECAKACPEMVVIPAGTFVMGSPDGETPVIGLDGKPKPGSLARKEEGRADHEGPQHEVRIAHAFAAGKFAVTFDEWDECNAQGGCPPAPDSNYGRVRKPAINVSWDDAQKYVTWLSTMTGKDYRLLSEAEWEYAARAGTSTAYSFGDSYPPSKTICEYANFADISLDRQVKRQGLSGFSTSDICDDGQVTTAEVGSYKPNGFGLYDMHGNVFQWTADCYEETYKDVPADGSAHSTGNCKSRVARGGSWNSTPDALRSAYRVWGTTVNRFNAFGFRVGRTLKP
jgi:formylglycine-generating enzyme required for sulfatase activity